MSIRTLLLVSFVLFAGIAFAFPAVYIKEEPKVFYREEVETPAEKAALKSFCRPIQASELAPRRPAHELSKFE